MKKLLIGFLALSLVVLGFVSCNSNAVTTEDGVATVSFSEIEGAVTKDLQSTVEHKEKANLFWRYTAVKQDEAGKSGQTGSGVANSLPVVTDSSSNWKAGLTSGTHSYKHTFSVGTWDFELYAFIGTGENEDGTPTAIGENDYVYYGKKASVTLQVGANEVKVAVTGISTGNGTVDFTGVTNLSDYSYVGYKIGSGAWTAMPSGKTISQAAGSYLAYVGAFATESYTTDPVISSSVQITVYRGLVTKITGLLDDQTAEVTFDADMPTSTATTTVTETAATTSSPAVNVTVAASPEKDTSAQVNNYKTTVSVPESALATSSASGDKYKVDVQVTAGQLAPTQTTFTVKTGEAAVAALDVKMYVTKNDETPQPKTSFDNSKEITVSTFIGKGLTGSYLVECQKNGCTYAHNNGCSYDSDSGYITFKTNHLSSFVVVQTAEAVIGNTIYPLFTSAVNAAASGDTIKLLKDVTVTNTVELKNGVTLDGTSGNDSNYKITATGSGWNKAKLLTTSSNCTVKNIVLDSGYDKNDVETTKNMASGVQAYNVRNVVFENVSFDNSTKAAVEVNASTITLKGGISMGGSVWTTDGKEYIGVGWGVNIQGGPDKCTVADERTDGTSNIYFWTDYNDIKRATSGTTTTLDDYNSKFEVTNSQKDVKVVKNIVTSGDDDHSGYLVCFDSMSGFGTGAPSTSAYAGCTAILQRDVNLGNWTPISNFTGTFDGNGKTISGMTIDNYGSDGCGLFGALEGYVKDLTISGASITNYSKSYCGFVAGSCSTNESNAVTNVTVVNSKIDSTAKYVGGIVGSLDGDVNNCNVSNCSITGKDQVGGVVGYLWCWRVSNCTSYNNTVTATEERAGGLIGKAQFSDGNSSDIRVVNNTVNGCTMTAPADNRAGGLVGEIMGDNTGYTVSGNNILGVSYTTVNNTNPIGVLRPVSEEGINGTFVNSLSGKLSGNNYWDTASLATREFTYVGSSYNADDQLIKSASNPF